MTEGSKWLLGRLIYVLRSIDYRWLHLQYEEIYQSEKLKKAYLASCLLEKKHNAKTEENGCKNLQWPPSHVTNLIDKSVRG